MIPGRDREEDGTEGDDYADELRAAAIGRQDRAQPGPQLPGGSRAAGPSDAPVTDAWGVPGVADASDALGSRVVAGGSAASGARSSSAPADAPDGRPVPGASGAANVPGATPEPGTSAAFTGSEGAGPSVSAPGASAWGSAQPLPGDAGAQAAGAQGVPAAPDHGAADGADNGPLTGPDAGTGPSSRAARGVNRNSGHQEPGVFPIGATEGADETRFLPDNAFAGGDDPLAGFVAASAGARAADTAAVPAAPRRRRRVLLPVLTILCLLAGLGLTGWGAMLALRPSAAGSAEPSPIAPMTSQLADPAATPAPAVTAPAATEPAGTGTAVPGASPGGVPAIAGDVTSAESITVMVNKRTPLTPQDHVPGDLVPMSSIGVPSANDHSLRAEAAEAVSRMFQAAAAEGYALDMTSGYRSYASQAELYDGYVASLGQEAADATSARPGYSEHQTGLAADISAPSAGCVLEQCFAQTAEGQWLAENAWQYGFILRYPEGMTSVTGYEFEPWHYRFVGTEVATAMRDGGYASYEHFLGYPAAPGYEG